MLSPNQIFQIYRLSGYLSGQWNIGDTIRKNYIIFQQIRDLESPVSGLLSPVSCLRSLRLQCLGRPYFRSDLHRHPGAE